MTTFTTPINQIESLHVGYFGRAGDPAGTNYRISQLNSGAITLSQIAASLVNMSAADYANISGIDFNNIVA